MKIIDPWIFQSCFFLINPQKSPTGAQRLKRCLRKLPAARVVESRSRAHFIESVRIFCSSDREYLLVYGGDGSIHTAINEIVRYGQCRRKIAVGFLRGGSGNGYQDSYSIPGPLGAQLSAFSESLRERFVMEVDLLKIASGEKTVYGQLVGIGFDARVLGRRDARQDSEKVQSGLFNYLLPALLQFFRDFHRVHREYNFELLYGGSENVRECSGSRRLNRTVRCRMIEIGKRAFYGNRFRICPDALCNSGCMEVYLFNFNRRVQVVRHMGSLWRGRYEKINRKGRKPFVEHYRGKSIKLTTCSPIEVHVDGELFYPMETEDGICSITVSVVPHAISFVVPGEFYRKYRFSRSGGSVPFRLFYPFI